MNRDKFGFQQLAKKSLAVITAAISSITSGNAATMNPPISTAHDKDLHIENFHRNVLKPKLVLKLNMTDPANSLVLMHSSHSSHRSHSSHSSHSSHYSSSYSSGGSSYTPAAASSSSSSYLPLTSPAPPTRSSNSTPATRSGSSTPSSGAVYNLSHTNSQSIRGPIDSSQLDLGSRTLYKGCEGRDVEQLQKMLSLLKGDMFVTGYFGAQTEQIVIRFQQDNELRPNGVVDSKTLNAIRARINGNSSRQQ